MQGGEIFADSEGAGKGTMVTFYLPLQARLPIATALCPHCARTAQSRG